MEPEQGAQYGVSIGQNSGNKLLPPQQPGKSRKKGHCGWQTAVMVAFISGVCLLIARTLKFHASKQPRSNTSERRPHEWTEGRGLWSRRMFDERSEKEIAAQLAEHETWRGGGGEFGLQADWRQALLASDGFGGQSLRGGACLTDEKQAEVRHILRKRASKEKKVAACLRTKDMGRFLPEWIAFHYVTGVDEISIYDDYSADNTSDVLRPFVEAGIVRYKLYEIPSKGVQMNSLHECLQHYLDRHHNDSDVDAPTWVTFHDQDEYLYPVDTDLTIDQALDNFNTTCCMTVPRTQFGSSGHVKTPPGLILESFLLSKGSDMWQTHGWPKVMANMNPARPELGEILPTMKEGAHWAFCASCPTCDKQCPEASNRKDMRINHYLGSRGDYLDHKRHYWAEYYNIGNVSPEEKFKRRDGNGQRNDIITHWACATREILFRIAQGLDTKG